MTEHSRWPVWVGAAFMLSGLAIICVGTGVIPVDPLSMRAPGWIIALCGAVFVLAGLMAFVEIVGDAFVDPLAILFILSFATVAAWVAFGRGDGAFYGSVSLGPSSAAGGMREMISRMAFGLGAITLVTLAAGIFLRWVGQLRATSERAGYGRVESGPRATVGSRVASAPRSHPESDEGR